MRKQGRNGTTWSAGRMRVLAALVAACAACGSDDDDDSNGPSGALEISPSSATVAAGGTPATFTATLTGLAATINWSLEGPGSISAETGTTTVYTPPPTAAQQTTATLTASAGDESDEVTITVTPSAPPITVSGTVVDSCLNPVQNIVVWIRNRGITVTDASGAFSFTGVTPPYDIGHLQDTPVGKLIRIYSGISATSVRLKAAEAAASVREGTIQGNLTAGAGSSAVFPVPLGRRTRFAFGAQDNILSEGFLTDVNPYSLDVSWCGGASVTGTVHAMQWTTSANPNIAQTFDGYGTTTATVTEGNATPGSDVILEAVTTTTLTGSVAAPPGYIILTRGVSVDLPDIASPRGPAGLMFNFALQQQGLPADFSVPAPQAPGLQLLVEAEAQGASGVAETWLHGAVAGTNATVGMNPAPELLAPATGATGVDLANQAFTWSPVPGTIYGLFTMISYPFGQGTFIRSLNYQVFTSATSYRLPLPQELGLTAIPAGSRGEWHVGTANEPSVVGLVSPTRDVLFGEGALGTVLPFPEVNEIRHSRHLGDTRFSLP